MTLEQTKQILAIFSAVYRRAFVGMEDGDVEFMANIWQRKLAPFSYEEVMEATEDLISSSKFMPSLAEVLEELAKKRCPEATISPTQAWMRVRNAIWDYGLEGLKEAKKHLTELEISAIRAVGWTRLCTADRARMNELKEAFLDSYQHSQTRAMTEIKAGSLDWMNTLQAGKHELVNIKAKAIEGGIKQ